MLNSSPECSRVAAAKPDRRPWLLEWLGFHCRAFQLPEAPVERDPGFAPQRFHHLQAFIEPRNQAAGVYAERREHPDPSSRANAYLEAASTELVESAQAFGQVDRAVQWRDEYRAPQTQSFGAAGRVSQNLDRVQMWR